MFRKRQTILNGVELPEEFSGGSIVNDVAISADGRRYAYVHPQGGLVTGDMPRDGKLKIGGTVIEYRGTPKPGGFSSNVVRIGLGGISVVSVSGGGSSVVVSGSGSVHVGSGGLEYEIDKPYDSVNAVTLCEIANDVTLALSEDDKVYVQGFTGSEPENIAGRLSINGLGGSLKLPKSRESLTLEARLTSADIRGAIAHGGRITTISGDLDLELYAPLALEVRTITGEVSVKGMMAEGRGFYNPPNVQPKGKLSVETTSGDINVKYMQR